MPGSYAAEEETCYGHDEVLHSGLAGLCRMQTDHVQPRSQSLSPNGSSCFLSRDVHDPNPLSVNAIARHHIGMMWKLY